MKKQVRRWVTMVGIMGTVSALSGCDLGFFLKPTVPFEKATQPPAPDYDRLQSWAAHPDLTDKSALLPEGFSAAADAGSDSAAVFFLHPTAWMSRTQWNADFAPGPSREIVDEISMGTQASAFTGVGEVFAPRYRQATLGAFYAPQPAAQQAFALAYTDVERAFARFVALNPNRPFILAGHSQGSVHLMRLIQDHVINTPLQQNLVAAYLPGMGLPLSWYRQPALQQAQLIPCETPDQTGCVAAWDTYKSGAAVEGQEPVYYWQDQQVTHLPPDAPRQCTHPIHWQAAAATEPNALREHKGSAAMINTGKAFAFSDVLFASEPLGIQVTGLDFKPHWVQARCDGKALRVPDLKALDYPVMETQPGNYHLLDYELFWADIRENALTRLQAWRGQQKQ